MGDIKLNIDNNIINVFTSKSTQEILQEFNLNTIYQTKQIHSNIVHIIDENYLNGSIGDALITNNKNKPLIIKIADCVPIILYDKENQALALIHSGWKGTLENITENTIRTMKEKFNSKEENIQAFIYPSIRKCHFENRTHAIP